MFKKFELKPLEADLFYLMACALNEAVPDVSRVNSMDLAALHKLACKHSVDALVAFALLACWNGPDAAACSVSDEVLSLWVRSEAEAQYREALFAAERTKIMEGLGEQGIWHMPLKGAIVKDLYPRDGLRQMCDIDILFDAAYRVQVREWMETLGYKRFDKSDTHHEMFLREPIYNVEMHNRLFDTDRETAYYEDVKNRLVPVEGAKCRFAFTPEDSYIFMLVHARKHFCGSGLGVRNLADFLVLQRAQGDDFDHAYVERECEKLDLVEFAHTISTLSNNVLGSYENRIMPDKLSEDELQMLAVMFGSGTYGSIQSRVRIQVGSGTREERSAYVLRRLFPPMKSMKSWFPVLTKHPVLAPGFYVFRIARVLLNGDRFRRTVSEVRTLRELKNEKENTNG